MEVNEPLIWGAWSDYCGVKRVWVVDVVNSGGDVKGMIVGLCLGVYGMVMIGVVSVHMKPTSLCA